MAHSFLHNEKTALRMRDLPFFRFSFLFAVVLVALQIAFPTWRILPIIYGEQVVPLHYNIHIGVDTIGVWWQIYTVPVVGLIFIILNASVARFVWKREPMLSYLIASATVFLEALLFIAMIFIVLLNISYG